MREGSLNNREWEGVKEFLEYVYRGERSNVVIRFSLFFFDGEIERGEKNSESSRHAFREYINLDTRGRGEIPRTGN